MNQKGASVIYLLFILVVLLGSIYFFLYKPSLNTQSINQNPHSTPLAEDSFNGSYGLVFRSFPLGKTNEAKFWKFSVDGNNLGEVSFDPLHLEDTPSPIRVGQEYINPNQEYFNQFKQVINLPQGSFVTYDLSSEDLSHHLINTIINNVDTLWDYDINSKTSRKISNEYILKNSCSIPTEYDQFKQEIYYIGKDPDLKDSSSSIYLNKLCIYSSVDGTLIKIIPLTRYMYSAFIFDLTNRKFITSGYKSNDGKVLIIDLDSGKTSRISPNNYILLDGRQLTIQDLIILKNVITGEYNIYNIKTQTLSKGISGFRGFDKDENAEIKSVSPDKKYFLLSESAFVKSSDPIHPDTKNCWIVSDFDVSKSFSLCNGDIDNNPQNYVNFWGWTKI